MSPNDVNQSMEGAETPGRGEGLSLHLTPTELRRWGKFGTPGKEVSREARDAAKDIDGSSRRRIDTPVRKHFVRSSDGARPPLSRLYNSGGRGGAVAVKLYLALMWRCSSEPWTTNKPAKYWATLLDLPDPEGEGARRIHKALHKLADLQLITLTRVGGSPSIVTMLDEHADGSPYTPPSTAYGAAKSRRAKRKDLELHTYFKVPSKLWIKGRMQRLEGPGLVMLLILLAERAGDGILVWFSTDEFPNRYFISHKTRAEGTAELQSRGLLVVERQPVGDHPRSRSFDMKRRRNVYQLTSKAQVKVIEDKSIQPSLKAPPPPPPPRIRTLRELLNEDSSQLTALQRRALSGGA